MLTKLDKKILKAIPFLLALAIGSGLADAWVDFSLEEVPRQEAKNYGANENNAAPKILHYQGVSGLIAYAVRFFVQYSEPLLAAGTIAIAFYTLMLFRDAREKGRKELRAYLGIKEAKIHRLPNGQFQAVIVVENSGRTPAREVRRSLNVGWGPRTGPEQGPDFPIGILTGQMQLAPTGQWETRQILWNLPEKDIERIALHPTDRFAFVWGRVEYLDIYDELQHVNFRFITLELVTAVARFPDGRTVPVLIGWALHPTEQGNDAS